MNTIETTFAIMIVFTTFTTIVSFSTTSFNNISNNIRKKQIEFSYGYDTNYDELKNEYDLIVNPRTTEYPHITKKIYNPEFVLRALSLEEKFNNKESTGNKVNSNN